MKSSTILVVLTLALTLSLPAVAAASPPNPCGEMHRKVDVDGLPLCAPFKPVRPAAGPRSQAPRWERPVVPPPARIGPKPPMACPDRACPDDGSACPPCPPAPPRLPAPVR